MRNTEIILSTRRNNAFSFYHMVGTRSWTIGITTQYKTSPPRGRAEFKLVKL